MTSALKEYFDFKTAAITFALVFIGIISVYSATYDARASEIFQKQVFWAIGGTLAFAIITLLPFRFLQFLA